MTGQVCVRVMQDSEAALGVNGRYRDGMEWCWATLGGHVPQLDLLAKQHIIRIVLNYFILYRKAFWDFSFRTKWLQTNESFENAVYYKMSNDSFKHCICYCGL